MLLSGWLKINQSEVNNHKPIPKHIFSESDQLEISPTIFFFLISNHHSSDIKHLVSQPMRGKKTFLMITSWLKCDLVPDFWFLFRFCDATTWHNFNRDATSIFNTRTNCFCKIDLCKASLSQTRSLINKISTSFQFNQIIHLWFMNWFYFTVISLRLNETS